MSRRPIIFPFLKELEEMERILSEEKKSNILPFERPAPPTGGGGTDGPWIMRCEQGDMIACRNLKESKDFNCPVFTIIHKTPYTVRIVSPQLKIDTRVDPVRFCNQWGFVEVLAKVDLNSILNDEGSLINEEEEKGEEH